MLRFRKLLFVAFIVLLPAVLFAEKKTVCLNMIVKNESSVITRCLESVLPVIDYWVISDTGSTDGTQQIIIDYMKENNVPGELHENPWKNFSHNRNLAMNLAKGKADYILFIDADEYFVYDDDFELPELDKDYYYFTLHWPGVSHWKKITLLNNHLDWEWVGVLHEVICPPASRSCGTIEKVKNIYTVDGARSKDPKKYEKDAQVLEDALKDDPNNSRYIFYLAQSYLNGGQKEKALENYKKRAERAVGMNDSEASLSLMHIALIQKDLHYPADVVIQSFKKACTYSRNKQEPYYHLSCYYRELGDYTKSYLVASIGKTIPMPNDLLWIDEWIYRYGMLMEVSVSSYWIGKYKECQEASLAMLKVEDLPDNYKECAISNLGFANAKLLEEVCSTPPVVMAGS